MDELLADLQVAERQLRSKAGSAPGVTEHADALMRLADAVTVRPRLILMGEVNAGKTSLANLLLGQAILPAGILANTKRPVVLRHADVTTVTGMTLDQRVDLGDEEDLDSELKLERIEVTIPSPRLQSYDLVDTPGNSTFARLDRLRLRTSDVLVWCTPAIQAWKESERRMWMSVPPRFHRTGILVATHRDCLHDKDDIRQVSSRLATDAGRLFRSIVLVASSERADRQLRMGDGLAELDDTIAQGLAAIAQRRAAAGYQIAGHIIRRATTLMEVGPIHGWLRSTFGGPPRPKVPAVVKGKSKSTRPKTRRLMSGWGRRSR